MKGYKAFYSDLTCRGFQYEIGKTYKYDGEIEPCGRGFHFCKDIGECYNFYIATDATRICEVEALGKIKTDDGIKYVTDKIKIIAEVTDDWRRKGNTVSSNCGYCNTGSKNTGNCNTGYYNTGNCNAGDWNSGYLNTGDWNAGYRNTGYWNLGNRNTGDWNATNFSSGCFCTVEPEMLLFDKPSGMTLVDFHETDACQILRMMPTEYTETEWDDTANTLKVIKHKADRQKWYDELLNGDKNIIKSMPNFDADKFYKCTGIRV